MYVKVYFLFFFKPLDSSIPLWWGRNASVSYNQFFQCQLCIHHVHFFRWKNVCALLIGHCCLIIFIIHRIMRKGTREIQPRLLLEITQAEYQVCSFLFESSFTFFILCFCCYCEFVNTALFKENCTFWHLFPPEWGCLPQHYHKVAVWQSFPLLFSECFIVYSLFFNCKWDDQREIRIDDCTCTALLFCLYVFDCCHVWPYFHEATHVCKYIKS